jgi:hypothetical protein
MARAETFIAEGKRYLTFRCPGCQSTHMVTAPPSPIAWGFNGDLDRPTLTPSVLVSYDGPNAGEDRGGGDLVPPARCHSFVTDGRIQFLADSTHALAGQTVDLPEIV